MDNGSTTQPIDSIGSWFYLYSDGSCGGTQIRSQFCVANIAGEPTPTNTHTPTPVPPTPTYTPTPTLTPTDTPTPPPGVTNTPTNTPTPVPVGTISCTICTVPWPGGAGVNCDSTIDWTSSNTQNTAVTRDGCNLVQEGIDNGSTTQPIDSIGSWFYLYSNGACGGDQLDNQFCAANVAPAPTNTPTPTATPTPDLTCSVDLNPVNLPLAPSETGLLNASETTGAAVNRVEFVSNDTGVATVGDTGGPYGATHADSGEPYITEVYAEAPGSTTVRANVYLDSDPATVACWDESTIQVDFEPWFQTANTDVTAGGDIQSDIPSGYLFSTTGGGGYPGVPVYGNATNLSSSSVSTEGWLANSVYRERRRYDYEFFRSLVSSSIVLNAVPSSSEAGSFFESGGTTDAAGYTWYLFDGDAQGSSLTISSDMTLSGGRKVILFVKNADLTLQGRINLDNLGLDFFMVIVQGDINIDAAVSGSPSLEGVYVADDQARTGAGGNQLHLRGMITAWNGFVLQRDLGAANADTPAEVFEYAPELLFTYPRSLTLRRRLWKEVAP